MPRILASFLIGSALLAGAASTSSIARAACFEPSATDFSALGQTARASIAVADELEVCDYWRARGEDFASYVGQQTMSCLCGIGALGDGVVQAVIHPIRTGKGLAAFAEHPVRIASAIKDELVHQYAYFPEMPETAQAAFMCRAMVEVVLMGASVHDGVVRGAAMARRIGEVGVVAAVAEAATQVIRYPVAAARAFAKDEIPRLPPQLIEKTSTIEGKTVAQFFLRQKVGDELREIRIPSDAAEEIRRTGTVTVYRGTAHESEIEAVKSGQSLPSRLQSQSGLSDEQAFEAIRALHRKPEELAKLSAEHSRELDASPFISTTLRESEAAEFARGGSILKFQVPIDELIVPGKYVKEWELLSEGPIPHAYFRGTIPAR